MNPSLQESPLEPCDVEPCDVVLTFKWRGAGVLSVTKEDFNLTLMSLDNQVLNNL